MPKPPIAVKDPSTSLAWLALAPEAKASLLEAAGWVHNPLSLARYDGSLDFPVHPNNLTAAEAYGELICRAYQAAGAPAVPPRHEAAAQLAKDSAPHNTAPSATISKVQQLLAAASHLCGQAQATQQPSR